MNNNYNCEVNNKIKVRYIMTVKINRNITDAALNLNDLQVAMATIPGCDINKTRTC